MHAVITEKLSCDYVCTRTIFSIYTQSFQTNFQPFFSNLEGAIPYVQRSDSNHVCANMLLLTQNTVKFKRFLFNDWEIFFGKLLTLSKLISYSELEIQRKKYI